MMNWFKNAKIQTKLFFVFGVIMTLVLIPIVFMIVTINTAMSDFVHLNEGPNKRLIYVSDAVGELANIRRYILSMGYAADDTSAVDTYYERYLITAQQFLNHLDKYYGSLETDVFLSDEEKNENMKIARTINDRFSLDYKQYVSRIYLAALNQDSTMVDELVLNGIPIGDDITNSLWILRSKVQESTSKIAANTLSYVNRSIAMIVVFAFFLVFLLFMVSIFTTNITKEPIEKIEAAVKEIAKGNLSYPIRSENTDELGMLSNHIGDMVDTIAMMNKTVKIVDAMDQIIFVTDLDFNVLYINQFAADLYGFDREAAVNQKCYSVFYDGQECACETCPLPGMLPNKESLPSCEWEQYDDKIGIWLACRTAFIHWVDGNLAQVCIQKDNTFQKKHEEQQRQHKESLQKARQTAEEASRMKSSFLANMSHEIRTPMNGIMGFAELALDDEISPKTRDYLNKIKTNTKGLLQIINDILDISKIEAGKITIEHTPFELHEVFRNCQNIIEPKVQEKNVSFYCYAEPSLGRLVIGDPTRLRQVLLNLLSNAIKFTNNGMVKLLASITNSGDNTVAIHFEVKDSGIGMTPEQLKKVFDPFTQADESTTRKYGGTGLGLPITKYLVELMGGELKVESALGIGSKFSFNLVFDTIPQSDGVSAVDFGFKNMRKPCFKGEALICEDNHMNMMVILDHLSRVGIKTVPALNGKEGVDIVADRIAQNLKPFDLIFMDIHMPVMDGLEAAKRLSLMGCKTPIIALTANVMSTDREAYNSNGMADCMPKPFTAQELWHCLLKHLDPVSVDTICTYAPSNNEDLQQRLITNFIQDNQTTALDINAALSNGDTKLAYRLAHTLKSVSGLVGQTALRDAAQAVEQSLANSDTDSLEKHMTVVSRELDKSLKALSFCVPDPEYEEALLNEPGLDKPKILQLLERLKPLLEAGKGESIDLVNLLRGVAEADLLIKQVEEYEFELALETLEQMKEHLEAVQ